MNRLRIIVAILITLVWAVIYLRAFFDTDFNPPPEVSGIMLAAVTWLFGQPLRERVKQKIKEKLEISDKGD